MKKINEAAQNEQLEITAEVILFFDMDGTLVDTNVANFLSYKKAILSVAQSHNLIYDPAIRFTRSYLRIAVPNLTAADYNRIIEEKENCYNDFIPETKLNSEVVNILFKYSKTNKTVLVTNCREKRAVATLSYFGLVDKFSAVFYRQFADGDTKINKFENAISIMGISPKLVVAFENEETEIADAIRAGILIINPRIS